MRYDASSDRYTLIRKEDHPFRDKANFVTEHRLVAEKYLLTEKNSITINGEKYLKPEYVVHHIDFNKKNNDPNNLYIFENENLHILFHNLYRGKRVNDLDDFLKYYENKYVNKILNYDWLYKAYVIYGLSMQKISEIFDIPYKSIEAEIHFHNLKEIKEQHQKEYKDAILKLIIDDLEKTS